MKKINMKKKIFWSISIMCLILSIGAMAFPDAYIVKWCYPEPGDGRWTDSYSYFNITLLNNLFDSDDFITPFIMIAAFACNVFFLFQSVFKKLNENSYLILGIGILASFYTIASARFTTIEGYPNCIPLITAVAALIASGLLFLQLFIEKLIKPTFIVVSIGILASLFSLFMSHLITIYGIVISGSFLLSLVFIKLYIKEVRKVN